MTTGASKPIEVGATPPPGLGSCAECRYWQEPGEGWTRGTCRQHAPGPSRHGDDWVVHATWPFTAADEWCGGWERREET